MPAQPFFLAMVLLSALSAVLFLGSLNLFSYLSRVIPQPIVIALLVWGAVLGPMGALLAIPLTLALKEILPIFTSPPPPPARV
jgi:Kef-type K+ transport system membrane component KefB